MPKRLVDRLGTESIRGFRSAAEVRLADGDALALAGHRTGAIYLWGYAAEMCLKAWYFEVIAFDRRRRIVMADFRSADGRAKSLGTKNLGKFHGLVAWAELIRAECSYLVRPLANWFGNQLIAVAQKVQLVWCVDLRYHDNVASAREALLTREAVGWIVKRSQRK